MNTNKHQQNIARRCQQAPIEHNQEELMNNNRP
jgi:hypothetical protein